MAFSLQARVVYPVDRPAIEHGVVTIEGQRIVSVGPASSALTVHDLGDVALLPAFVNAHTHLEFSDLTHPLGTPGMPLVAWIRLVIAERAQRANPSPKAIAGGLRESLYAGVATIADIATADTIPSLDIPLSLAMLLEVIGFSRARAASSLAAIEQRLDSFRKASSRTDNLELGISPHAPYTVSPELLRQLVALASKNNLPVAMHLAESREEVQLLNSGDGPFRELLEERSMWDANAIPRGSRPADYLRILAEATRSLVIHGNYLSDAERLFLAERANRMTLIYCPRTHAYFEHPPYPLAEALAAGVRVAIATDSRASNPDLDMLAELRYAAKIHPRVSPDNLLRMATLDAAHALGCASNTGSLTSGKRADLVALPIPSGTSGSPDDVLAALYSAESPKRRTWLAGQEWQPNSEHQTVAVD
jgi:aminodeoxyfutalosine deaminase